METIGSRSLLGFWPFFFSFLSSPHLQPLPPCSKIQTSCHCSKLFSRGLNILIAVQTRRYFPRLRVRTGARRSELPSPDLENARRATKSPATLLSLGRKSEPRYRWRRHQSPTDLLGVLFRPADNDGPSLRPAGGSDTSHKSQRWLASHENLRIARDGREGKKKRHRRHRHHQGTALRATPLNKMGSRRELWQLFVLR